MRRRKTILVRLDARLVDELDAQAAKYTSSRTAVLSQILRARFPITHDVVADL